MTSRYKWDRLVTFPSKQYGEYQLSVLNGRREFMQLILTNSASPLKRCGESQLSIVNDMGSIDSPLWIIVESRSKITNISSNSKPNLKNLSSKRLGGTPSWKKWRYNKVKKFYICMCTWRSCPHLEVLPAGHNFNFIFTNMYRNLYPYARISPQVN